MEEWERRVPVIEGAKGYAGVMMPPRFCGAHRLAQLHAEPATRQLVGGLSARATTARRLAVGRTESGAWLVVHLETLEVLGSGATRDAALADAMAHDRAAAAQGA